MTSSWAQPDDVPFPSRSHLHPLLTFWSFDSISFAWNQSGEAQAALNEGINELQEGHLQTAEEQLSEAAGTDSKAFPAWYYRGVAYKLMRRYENAARDLTLYLSRVPDSFEAQAELGKVYALYEDMMNAEINFKKLIAMKPNDPRGHYYLGLYHLLSKNYPEAQMAFQKCVSLNPGFTHGLVQLAVITLARDNDFGKGMVYLNEALKKDSLHEGARTLRFMIHRQNGEYRAALTDVDFLARYDPLNLRLRFARGQLLVAMQAYDEAFGEFRKLLQMTALPDSVFVGQQTDVDRRIDIQNLGIYIVKAIYGLDAMQASAIRKAYCQVVVGDYDGARTTVESVKKESAIRYYIRAVALEHSQDFLAAQRAYARVLELDDDVFDAHKKRGILLTNQRKWYPAIEDFDAMERINPVAKITYKLRGVAYFFAEDFGQALNDFNHYLAIDSSNKEMFYNRGITYMRMGNLYFALRDCNRAGDYRDMDFSRVHQEFNRLQLLGDSAALTRFIRLVEPIPSTMNLGIMYQVFLIHRTWLTKDWDFIHFRYTKLITTGTFMDDKTYISMVLTAEAARLAALKNIDKALGLLDEAVIFDKRNALTYFERGKLLAEKGEVKKAQADWQKAAELGDMRAAGLLSSSTNNR